MCRVSLCVLWPTDLITNPALISHDSLAPFQALLNPPHPTPSWAHTYLPLKDSVGIQKGAMGFWPKVPSTSGSRHPLYLLTGNKNVMPHHSRHQKPWTRAVWKVQGLLIFKYQAFTEEMRRVFVSPVSGQEAVKQLLQLHQGIVRAKPRWQWWSQIKMACL